MESNPLATASKIEIPKPYMKIMVECKQDTHDGYCSDADEEDLRVVTKKTTYYLPVDKNWWFSQTSWEEENDVHYCCGAKNRFTILSFELVV